MGQEAGTQLRETVLPQQSPLGPLLPYRLALAQVPALWEGVGLLRRECVSELQWLESPEKHACVCVCSGLGVLQLISIWVRIVQPSACCYLEKISFNNPFQDPQR